MPGSLLCSGDGQTMRHQTLARFLAVHRVSTHHCTAVSATYAVMCSVSDKSGWEQEARQQWLTGGARDPREMARCIARIRDQLADSVADEEKELDPLDVVRLALADPHADRISTRRDQPLPSELVSLFLYQFERQHVLAEACMALLCGADIEPPTVVAGLRTLWRLQVEPEDFRMTCDPSQPYQFHHSIRLPCPPLPQVGLAEDSRDAPISHAPPVLCILRAVANGRTVERLFEEIGGLTAVQQDVFVAMTSLGMYFLPRVRRGNEDTDPYSSSLRVRHVMLEASLRRGAFVSQWGMGGEEGPVRYRGKVVMLGSLFLRDRSTQLHAWVLVMDNLSRVWLHELTDGFFPQKNGKAINFTLAELDAQHRERAGNQIYSALLVAAERFGISVSEPPHPLPPSSVSLQPFESRASGSLLNEVPSLHPGSCGEQREAIALFSKEMGGAGGFGGISQELARLLSFGNQAPVCRAAPRHGILAALSIAANNGLCPPATSDWPAHLTPQIQRLREVTEVQWCDQLSNDLRGLSVGLPETEGVRNESDMLRLLLDSPQFLCHTCPPEHDSPATIYTIARLWSIQWQITVLFLVHVQINAAVWRYLPYLVSKLDVNLPIVVIALDPQPVAANSPAVGLPSVTKYTLRVIGQREVDEATEDVNSSKKRTFHTVFSHEEANKYALYHRFLDLCKSVGKQTLHRWTRQVPGAEDWRGQHVDANFGTVQQTAEYLKLRASHVSAAALKRVHDRTRQAAADTDSSTVAQQQQDKSSETHSKRAVASEDSAIETSLTSTPLDQRVTHGRQHAAAANTQLSPSTVPATTAVQHDTDSETKHEPRRRLTRSQYRRHSLQPTEEELAVEQQEVEEEEREEDEEEEEEEEEKEEETEEKADSSERSSDEAEQENDGRHKRSARAVMDSSTPKKRKKQASVSPFKNKTDKQILELLIKCGVGPKPTASHKAPNVWQVKQKEAIAEFIDWFKEEPESRVCAQKYTGSKKTRKASLDLFTPGQKAGLHLAVALAFDIKLQQQYIEMGRDTWTKDNQEVHDWTVKAWVAMKSCPEARAVIKLPKKKPKPPREQLPWKDGRKLCELALLAQPAFDRRSARDSASTPATPSVITRSTAAASTVNEQQQAQVAAPAQQRVGRQTENSRKRAAEHSTEAATDTDTDSHTLVKEHKSKRKKKSAAGASQSTAAAAVRDDVATASRAVSHVSVHSDEDDDAMDTTDQAAEVPLDPVLAANQRPHQPSDAVSPALPTPPSPMPTAAVMHSQPIPTAAAIQAPMSVADHIMIQALESNIADLARRCADSTEEATRQSLKREARECIETLSTQFKKPLMQLYEDFAESVVKHKMEAVQDTQARITHSTTAAVAHPPPSSTQHAVSISSSFTRAGIQHSAPPSFDSQQSPLMRTDNSNFGATTMLATAVQPSAYGAQLSQPWAGQSLASRVSHDPSVLEQLAEYRGRLMVHEQMQHITAVQNATDSHRLWMAEQNERQRKAHAQQSQQHMELLAFQVQRITQWSGVQPQQQLLPRARGAFVALEDS